MKFSKLAGNSPPRVCVETGTYRGNGSLVLGQVFPVLHTIELSEKWYDFAKLRLRDNANITCHLGDSAEILTKLLPKILEPTMIFLDAHYSGGDTAFGREEVPLLRELEVISKRPYKDIILVDDLRLFGKTGSCGIKGGMFYPLMTFDWRDITIETIQAAIKNRTLGKDEYSDVCIYKDDYMVVFRNQTALSGNIIQIVNRLDQIITNSYFATRRILSKVKRLIIRP